MRRVVFDIEADGLSEVVINKKGNPVPEGKEIYCVVIQDVDNPKDIKRFGPNIFKQQFK